MFEITRLLFIELSVTSNMISKVSSGHEIHDQVQIFSILEWIHHVHDKPIRFHNQGMY